LLICFLRSVVFCIQVETIRFLPTTPDEILMDAVHNDDVARADLLSIAVEAAHAGGEILQDWVGRFSVREKKRADLVTEADHASQQKIFDMIAQRYPNHGFLGEEGLNKAAQNSDYRWVIDPLDGTSNYVHGFPYYAVSIGLQKADELVAGVIFDPNRNETFAATKGGGATLNGQPISTSGESNMAMAMAMASLPVGADRNHPAVSRFLNSMNHLQTVQRSGSAALNLACVACGRIDAFWSTSLKPWDVAAGVLIVQEAGGSVTDLAGGAVDIMESSLIAASTRTIAQNLADIFA